MDNVKTYLNFGNLDYENVTHSVGSCQETDYISQPGCLICYHMYLTTQQILIIRRVQIVNQKSTSAHKVESWAYTETHLSTYDFHSEWLNGIPFIKQNVFIYVANTQAPQKGKLNYKINAVKVEINTSIVKLKWLVPLFFVIFLIDPFCTPWL